MAPKVAWSDNFGTDAAATHWLCRIQNCFIKSRCITIGPFRKPNDFLSQLCDLFFYFAFFFLFSDKRCVPYNAAFHICPQRGWKTVHLSFNTTFKNSAKWCLCQIRTLIGQINVSFVKWRCLGVCRQIVGFLLARKWFWPRVELALATISWSIQFNGERDLLKRPLPASAWLCWVESENTCLLLLWKMVWLHSRYVIKAQ